MVQVHVVFNIENVEQLETVKKMLTSEELKQLEIETNVNEEWVEETLQSESKLNSLMPNSTDFIGIYEQYQKTGKQPRQIKTKKKTHELWNIPSIVKNESPIVVEYLRKCIHDFNEKNSASQVRSISIGFETEQGRTEDQLIYVGDVNADIVNEAGDEVEDTSEIEDELLSHIFFYFDDSFLYEHLIQYKNYSIYE